MRLRSPGIATTAGHAVADRPFTRGSHELEGANVGRAYARVPGTFRFMCDAYPTMTGMLSARTGDCPPSKEES
jgi:hypothetical protein